MSNIKRAALLAASGGAYVSAVYISFLYMTNDKQPQNTSNNCGCNKDKSKSGLSYITNPDRNSTYSKIAYAYDDEIAKDEIVMGINLMRRWLLYKHAQGHVLEVGAGTGRNIDYYPKSSSFLAKHEVTKVVLSELSEKMLQQAQKKITPRDAKLFELKQADAANLHMYEDNTFDTIVDTFGLCSFDDPISVLKELQRVVKKPNGKILLLEHGRSKKYEKLSNFLDKNAERHAKNWGCVWNRDLDDIMEKAGLKVDNLHTWHFGTTYYVVCRPGDVVVKKE
mmetsp:Transcript_1119/g.1641  ORF Transcript_1119/g.1641 Transcript_1119/m.1641 type:complete len:280 (+) Transcript_1119:306-1145(+)